MAQNQELAKITSLKSLEIYSPNYMSLSPKLRQVISPSDVFAIKGIKPLAVVVKDFGVLKTLALIKVHLIYLDELLDLNKSLTEMQIDFIAEQIIGRYISLNMLDIHVVLKRCASGFYGDLYERLSPPKILQWFADYFEERCEVASNNSLDHHVQNKETSHDTRSSETFAAKEHLQNLAVWKIKHKK